jgi:hypothetical protein
MTRPHICFIQAQGLPWTQSDVSAVRPGVRVKILSEDSRTGASTQIVAYPEGYELPAGQSLSVAEELFVLDGELRIGEVRHHAHCYAYLPAGFRRGPIATLRGAVVLSMFPGRVQAGSDTMHPDPVQTIEQIDPFEMPWAGGIAGSVTGKALSSSLATKMLRRDESSGEQTFLYCSQPHHPPPGKVMPGKFTHPMVEEIFVLAGSFVFGDVGIMGPGGYCYWREHQWHGPTGSATGYHLLIRNLGGPLENQFSTEPAPFSFDPPYRPQIPETLEPYAQAFRPPAGW